LVGIIETDNTAAKHYALKALGVLGQHATDKEVERLVALLDPHRRKFMLLRDTDDKVWELRALGVLGQRVVKDEHVKRVVDVLHDKINKTEIRQQKHSDFSGNAQKNMVRRSWQC
jgi:hypothetical protein